MADAIPQLSQSDAQSWYDFVANFDKAYQSFMDNYNALIALGPYIQSTHPELSAQYDQLVNDGATNWQRLQNLKATRDYAASWLNWLTTGAQGVFDYAKSLVGLSGYERASGFGLGPLLIVGIGAAVAALVIVTRWLTDTYNFAQRVNFIRDQEARGVPPAQAAAMATGQFGPPPSGEFLGIPWTLLAIAGIAIFLGPSLVRLIEGRK